jgi:hypothetical protein
VQLQEKMATNAVVWVVTDVPSVPDSVEQWANRTYSGAAVQIMTNIQESGKHSYDFGFLFFVFEAGIVTGCESGFGINIAFLTVVLFVCANSEGKLEAVTSTVDVVISLMQTPGRHSSDFLKEVAHVLKSGGEFLVQEPLLADAQELQVSYELSSILEMQRWFRKFRMRAMF